MSGLVIAVISSKQKNLLATVTLNEKV